MVERNLRRFRPAHEEPEGFRGQFVVLVHYPTGYERVISDADTVEDGIQFAEEWRVAEHHDYGYSIRRRDGVVVLSVKRGQ